MLMGQDDEESNQISWSMWRKIEKDIGSSGENLSPDNSTSFLSFAVNFLACVHTTMQNKKNNQSTSVFYLIGIQS